MFVNYVSRYGGLGGRGPLLSVSLDEECVHGCVSMGVCVSEIYVYGADVVVVRCCFVGSVVCGWWDIFCSGCYPGINGGDACRKGMCAWVGLVGSIVGGSE
jgi:hypothetical protein